MKYLSEFHYMNKKTKNVAQLLGQLVVELGCDSVLAYIQTYSRTFPVAGHLQKKSE